MGQHPVLAVKPAATQGWGAMPGAQSDCPFTRPYIYRS